MKYHETPIMVRFNEVDSYQMAWHGHYVAWMEVARNDLAGRFGLDATQLAAAGYLAPVVALEIKYLRPLRFGDQTKVFTCIRRAETATLEFACRIVAQDGETAATGRTVHAITDMAGVLQYILPPPVAELVERLIAYQEL